MTLFITASSRFHTRRWYRFVGADNRPEEDAITESFAESNSSTDVLARNGRSESERSNGESRQESSDDDSSSDSQSEAIDLEVRQDALKLHSVHTFDTDSSSEDASSPPTADGTSAKPVIPDFNMKGLLPSQDRAFLVPDPAL
jgi:hypothetical protein